MIDERLIKGTTVKDGIIIPGTRDFSFEEIVDLTKTLKEECMESKMVKKEMKNGFTMEYRGGDRFAYFNTKLKMFTMIDEESEFQTAKTNKMVHDAMAELKARFEAGENDRATKAGEAETKTSKKLARRENAKAVKAADKTNKTEKENTMKNATAKNETKAAKTTKTTDGKLSNLDTMKKMLAEKKSEKEIVDAFMKKYDGKEKAFVAKRVAIYMRLAGAAPAKAPKATATATATATKPAKAPAKTAHNFDCLLTLEDGTAVNARLFC